MINTLILLIPLFYVLYKFSTRNFDHWKKRGVPYVKPVPIFGNIFKVLTLRSTIGHLVAKFYNDFDTPYFGAFVMNLPLLVLRSPDLIKTILVKDFNTFSDRTILANEECDSLASKFLFFLKNPEWKFIRTKMSPVFSLVKLKNMLPLINTCAEDMNKYLEENRNKQSVDAKEVCAKYATDVIASCAFGITANSFESDSAEFRVNGGKIFGYSSKNAIRQIAYFLTPGIIKILKIPFFEPGITKFMRDVFWETLEEREKTNVCRNDVIDIIAQIKKQGVKDSRFEFVGDRVVAQAAQFYSAGFETVSGTLSFLLYEVCLHTDVQTRLRSEIKNTILEHGNLSYDIIQNMKYLEMVICETLRKYPVLPFLDRTCLQDYKVPGTDFIIDKGTFVYVPIIALHYDENYFPDPEVFDPERFSPENRKNIPPFVFIPFGEGPRMCIGERFGMLTIKLGLCRILMEYEIERSVDTPVPLVFETKTFLIGSRGGLPLKLKKITSDAA